MEEKKNKKRELFTIAVEFPYRRGGVIVLNGFEMRFSRFGFLPAMAQHFRAERNLSLSLLFELGNLLTDFKVTRCKNLSRRTAN